MSKKKILFNIGHPGHVYFFSNIIKDLKYKGYRVFVLARSKEMTYYLLDKLKISFIPISNHKKNFKGKLLDYFIRGIRTYKICKKIGPDIAMGIGDFYIAQIGKFLGFKSFVFSDTDHIALDPYMTYPFASYLVTPKCYKRAIPKNQIRYNGYHELSYLHPDIYKPNEDIYDFLKIEKSEKYVLVRFVSWNALHDSGHQGLSFDIQKKLVYELSKYAKVFISSEERLPSSLQKYKLEVPPERIHDVLYYSSLYVGEGATMASECSVLGTPSIYVNSQPLGYLDEQEKKYGLVFNFRHSKGVIEKAIEIISRDQQESYKNASNKLLKDNINVSDFVVNLID